MKKRTNYINNILSLLFTFAALFAVVYVLSVRYGGNVWLLLVGAVVAGVLNTFAHEAGHLIAGKRNKFAFSSMTVLFFRWKKAGKRTRFDFVMIGDQAGYTEMVPTEKENALKGYKKMSLGGIWASLVMTLIAVPSFFITSLPMWAYSIWSMFLPVGAYFLFDSALPMSSGGVRNDGAVVYGINKNDDESKVMGALLAAQAEMYGGKTPAEVGDNYFGVPQLPEDNPMFLMLLDALYNYYIDSGDYEKAKKTTERLLSLEEYASKQFMKTVKTDALYNACTFDYDAEKADDLMYELEKYLNNVNTATNVRAKLAYLIYVKKEKENAQAFYDKGIREAKRMILGGMGEYEKKLFDKMKEDF